MYLSKFNSMALAGTAEDLTGAAVRATYNCSRAVIVRKIMFNVKTAVVSTGSVVVTVKKYILPGNSAGASTLGTITIPAGTAAGVVVYKQLSDSAAKLAVGDQLVFEVTTAAAGGGAAGDGYSMFELDDVPEVSANNSKMLASA